LGEVIGEDLSIGAKHLPRPNQFEAEFANYAHNDYDDSHCPLKWGKIKHLGLTHLNLLLNGYVVIIPVYDLKLLVFSR